MEKDIIRVVPGGIAGGATGDRMSRTTPHVILGPWLCPIAVPVGAVGATTEQAKK